MKSVASSSTLQRTRRAILEAMVDVIMEADGIGFSVQAVADRAGVTHRTIYNHFPTREALCDAFSDYVDESLAAGSGAPEPAWSLAELPVIVEGLYRALASRDRHARAYVMLMIGNRRPMTAWRKRSLMAEKLIAGELSAQAPLTARQVAAVIRMFVSTMGWHLLTEQCGLSNDEAAGASAWATRTLLDAAITKSATKRAAKPSSSPSQGAANARRRRRNEGPDHVQSSRARGRH